MSDKETIAAIDVGSNAIRMVLGKIQMTEAGTRIAILKKFRFPIRLGIDVFHSGKISGKNLKASTRAFMKFAEMARKHKVAHLRAVGTSALREAQNQSSFIELIKRTSGITIDVIDGIQEAKLIYQAVRHEVHLTGARALLIDIGGGSVELTITHLGKVVGTKSFPFGTVRTLEQLQQRGLSETQLNLVVGDFIRPLSEFLHGNEDFQRIDFAVGTGGNMDTLSQLKVTLLKKNSRRELSDVDLERIIQKLRKMTIRQRIERLAMRPDRADVVMPAAFVIQAILRQASVHRLVIPGVGLKEGLLWQLVRTPRKLKRPRGPAPIEQSRIKVS